MKKQLNAALTLINERAKKILIKGGIRPITKNVYVIKSKVAVKMATKELREEGKIPIKKSMKPIKTSKVGNWYLYLQEHDEYDSSIFHLAKTYKQYGENGFIANVTYRSGKETSGFVPESAINAKLKNGEMKQISKEIAMKYIEKYKKIWKNN